MTGVRIGLLTVVSKSDAEKRGTDTGARWNCVCDCGKELVVTRRKLQQGGTRSCGAKEHRRQPKGPDRLVNKLRMYIVGANARGIPWALSDEDFARLAASPCFYCGTGGTPGPVTVDDWIVATGVDRFHNDQGYTPENCVPCCTKCNTAKNTMTGEEYIAHCSAVAYRFFKQHDSQQPH